MLSTIGRLPIAVTGFSLCLLIILLLPSIFGTSGKTVQDYLTVFRKDLEGDLNKPNNVFAKHIEDIHLTVTYKGGHVKALTAKTIDGTVNAGSKGSNISEVSFVVTAYWEGLIQSDGYTEMSIVWDNQARQIKSVNYLDSNAMFNSATVDWFAVGKTIGVMLAYAYFSE